MKKSAILVYMPNHRAGELGTGDPWAYLVNSGPAGLPPTLYKKVDGIQIILPGSVCTQKKVQRRTLFQYLKKDMETGSSKEAGEYGVGVGECPPICLLMAAPGWIPSTGGMWGAVRKDSYSESW